MDIIRPDEIIKSKRKTLCLTVGSDLRLTAKIPLRVTLKQLDAFIVANQQWIHKTLSAKRRENEILSPYINAEIIRLFGKDYKVVQGKKSFEVLDGVIKAPAKLFTIDRKKFVDKTAKWLKNTAAQHLPERTEEILKTLLLQAAGFKLINGKSKWGACNSKQIISLNWRCIFLERELIDYIIIHEAAHLQVLNHSPKFWAAVEAKLPGYKALRKKLKSMSYLMKLY